jgi:hypothetical protein
MDRSLSEMFSAVNGCLFIEYLEWFSGRFSMTELAIVSDDQPRAKKQIGQSISDD